MNREEIVEKIEDYKRQIKENQAYQIKYQDIRDIINSLPIIHENRLIDDPFKDTEKTLFYEFSIFLIGINQYDFAIESLQKYYSRCLELELNSNTHIKKGSILFFIAKSLNQSYMKDQAFYYWILAFLEDIISEHFQTQRYENLLDALKSPACDLLQLVFHIPFINLEKLIIRAAGILSKQSDILNPELLKFHLSKNGFQIPRLVDYISYKPNIIYLKKMKEKIEKENNHKLWEEFAAFLFSSIDGIDPMINVRPGDGSYEFDVILRNHSNINPIITSLGEYIAIECKYYSDNVINVEKINHFASKLKYHDMKSGIFFTKTALSGWRTEEGEQYGKLIQTKIFNRNNIIIFTINYEDIKKLLDGLNLIELIIEKYESVRLSI